MDCAYFQNLIENEADKALSREQREALEAHVRQCPECRALQEAYAFLSRELSEDLAEAPETLLPGVMEAVWAENRQRMKRKNRKRWTGFVSAAACIALAVGLGYPLLAPKGGNMESAAFDAAPAAPAAVPAAPAYGGETGTEARSIDTPAERVAGESEAYIPEPVAEAPASEPAEPEMAAVPMLIAEGPDMDAAPVPAAEEALTEAPAADEARKEAAASEAEPPANSSDSGEAPPAEAAPAEVPAPPEPSAPTLTALSILCLGADTETVTEQTGMTIQLEATLSPAEVVAAPQWSSTDEAVATVDQTGLVTLTGEGSCYIILSADGLEDRCQIISSTP